MLGNDSAVGTLLQDHALESLADLERNRTEAIKLERSSKRVFVKSKVIAQLGNSSDRQKLKLQGITGDVSAGGCQILFPISLQVGDIYWLTFEKSVLDIGSTFARCLRCRLIREDAFEVGFKFFEPVNVSDTVRSPKAESLFD